MCEPFESPCCLLSRPIFRIRCSGRQCRTAREPTHDDPCLLFSRLSHSSRRMCAKTEAIGMDVSRLIVIWPNNVDSTKTIKKGRRIAKTSACEFLFHPSPYRSPHVRFPLHMQRNCPIIVPDNREISACAHPCFIGLDCC